MHDHHNHDHDGHGHEHGHTHSHSHDAPAGDMPPKDEIKLRITRWRDHNREHQQTLVEWSGKIRAQGLEDTAAAMDKAADLLSKSVAELDNALATLD